jgi:molecular chaperone DnaJ
MRQGIFQMVRTCPACAGSGQVIVDKCPTCTGSGRQLRDRKLDVKIPPGIHDGQAIRVPGEGEPGTAGGPRGDLHIVVSVKPHEVFERQDDNLVLHMPISFTQAALGATIDTPTLSESVELTITPGTQHGQTFTLDGHGLPNLRTGRRGDLLVQVHLEIPRKLTARQEELLRQFAETEDRDVLPAAGSFWDKIKNYLSGE